MADPVDDDETFVKETDDSNDDNLLSIAVGGSPETGFNILSAQQPQGESIFLYVLEFNVDSLDY